MKAHGGSRGDDRGLNEQACARALDIAIESLILRGSGSESSQL